MVQPSLIPPSPARRIVEAIDRELAACPPATQAARGGTLVVIVKLDRNGQPVQIQLKIDRPRTTIAHS